MGEEIPVIRISMDGVCKNKKCKVKGVLPSGYCIKCHMDIVRPQLKELAKTVRKNGGFE